MGVDRHPWSGSKSALGVLILRGASTMWQVCIRDDSPMSPTRWVVAQAGRTGAGRGRETSWSGRGCARGGG